jgi:hypothetical protein
MASGITASPTRKNQSFLDEEVMLALRNFSVPWLIESGQDMHSNLRKVLVSRIVPAVVESVLECGIVGDDE